MLLPSGDVCLIDFNVALVSGNDVRLISRSLGYASPEQYEIYERYKNRNNAPIHSTDGTDWKRSDIYSLGATVYHLLTGTHPPERAKELVPVSKLGHFSEGMIYVIEQSMRFAPAERFASAAILCDAVKNIHKHDSRWKISQSKKIAAAIILPLAFALFAGTALFGRSVMAQEKEERYYDAVYNIENGADPQGPYDAALAMFWDRIDPYRAMAERLWNDGDLDACREYIEANLGNIAEFQAAPEAARGFGDIYYILGNCYYYQSGEPDYFTAMGNFEIAVRFVKDNPIYYRDYAISLARSGEPAEAERILEKAQALNLDTDSINLLKGEIGFVKQEYGNAVDFFGKVIAQTTDDYVRYRAYHTSDEIFKLQGQPDRSAILLADGLNKIPVNRVPEMTERLADAYVKCGDYDDAIALFEKLSESGVPQFHTLQNLAILLENQGDFDRAAKVLNDMTGLFPNDYRVPMHQAYFEADRQSKIQNENRDYALTKRYYDAATKLYDGNVQPGESDPEMQRLDSIIRQLKANRWID
jgi:serine/threonine-protein kinase